MVIVSILKVVNILLLSFMNTVSYPHFFLVDAESAVSPTPEITLAAPSTASQSVDDMISNQNDILNTLTNENNAPVTPMANPLTSPTRKTSILTSTNPDLINTLNKMLSGGKSLTEFMKGLFNRYMM